MPELNERPAPGETPEAEKPIAPEETPAEGESAPAAAEAAPQE